MLDRGTVVAGYRVEAFLAAGGMGAVYRATQLSLERTVALKLLSDALSQDPAFRARFRREAVLQAALDHPHIVTVYEAGESPHGLFIAMRFLDGASLEEAVGSLPRSRALDLLDGVASALDAAHAAGLVHRDVKPQNILVSDDVAYLADFGLTTAPGLSSVTSAGQFIGTVDYIAPEQIRDEQADARSDIYSLGAVLYRCLTGSVPFPRATKVAVVYAQLEQLPEPATALAPDLPASLDPVLARALAKDPAERYASAKELVRAVTAELEGHPASLRPPPAAAIDRPTRAKSTTTAEAVAPPPARSAPPPRPRGSGVPAVLVATVSLILALAAGAGAYLLRHAGSTAPPPLGPTMPVGVAGVSVQVPQNWTARTIPLPEVFGEPRRQGTTGQATSAVAMGPPGVARTGVVIGLSRGFGPSMLPTPLQAVPNAPATLGAAVLTHTDYQGRLYTFVNPRGFTDTAGLAAPSEVPARRYSLLFAPTAHLNATVACVAPSGSAADGLFAACPRIMSSLTASTPGLDPRLPYAHSLSTVFTRASRVETTGLHAAAHAPTRAAQAAAYRRIARAFTAAEIGLRELVGHTLTAPELGTNVGLRTHLGLVAEAYSALASATTGATAGYPAAAARVAQQLDDLATVIGELRNAGYTLES